MSTRITVEGKLASDRADALRDELSAATASLEIDGTEVSGIGALCAQELYRARAVRSRTGGSWKLQASHDMRADLDLMGLTAILETLGDEE